MQSAQSIEIIQVKRTARFECRNEEIKVKEKKSENRFLFMLFLQISPKRCHYEITTSIHVSLALPFGIIR